MDYCPTPLRVFAGAELKLVSPSCWPTQRRMVACGRLSRAGGRVLIAAGLPTNTPTRPGSARLVSAPVTPAAVGRWAR